MKKFFYLLFVSFFPFSSFGADSAWYLCSNDHLVVNFFEHRASADTRDTFITMIYGGYTFMGNLGDKIAGPVVLKNSRYKGAGFTGHTAIDFSKETFTVKGVLNLLGGDLKVDTTLNCQVKTGK